MTLPKVLLWLHGEGICADFCISSQKEISFLCASFWINYMSSLLCCTSALTFLVTAVLASTAGFGLQHHLKTEAQNHQGSLKSPIFAHGLSGYRRVFWILGASNIAPFYSLLKGKAKCNKYAYRKIVCTTVSVPTQLRNKYVPFDCRPIAVALPEKWRYYFRGDTEAGERGNIRLNGNIR